MSTALIRIALVALALGLSPALAQTTDIDAFKDAGDDAKVHASGFVCPLFIGHFERDAYGERDPSIGADFCAYSAIDGVYGTITLTPLKSAYVPEPDRAAFAASFQKRMDEFVAAVDQLEEALKAGNNAEAARLAGELDRLQKTDHKEFRRPEKDEKK